MNWAVSDVSVTAAEVVIVAFDLGVDLEANTFRWERLNGSALSASFNVVVPGGCVDGITGAVG